MNPDPILAIGDLLRNLQQAHFYGELTIKFSAGNPQFVHKHETILIENLSRKGTNPGNVQLSRQ